MRKNRIKVVMAGVDEATKRGMWAVVKNYLNSNSYNNKVEMTYISSAAIYSASKFKKIFHFIRSYTRFSRAVRESAPEIVHLHVSEKGSVYRKAILAKRAKRAGTKVILHMHGGSFFRFYDKGRGCDRYISQKLMEMSNAVVVLGGKYKESLMQIGIPGDKIYIIANGVVMPERGSKPSFNNFEMVYLGGVTLEKGMKDLLDALELSLCRLPSDYHVSLYGPLSAFDIEKAISNRGLSRIVSYGGIVGDHEKEIVYRGARYAILPSHFEVLPMFLLEAMSYGLPVLSTRVGLVDEVIVDGENGILCDPNEPDAIAEGLSKLLSLSDFDYSRMSESARKTVLEEFSLKKHIESIVSLYEEILAND